MKLEKCKPRFIHFGWKHKFDSNTPYTQMREPQGGNIILSFENSSYNYEDVIELVTERFKKRRPDNESLLQNCKKCLGSFQNDVYDFDNSNFVQFCVSIKSKSRIY